MADYYDVLAKVISQKGTCSAEHKVGDEWFIKDKTPEGICLAAYNAIYPNALALICGGAFPWEEINREGTTAACPDADNPVVFELRRLPKQAGAG